MKQTIDTLGRNVNAFLNEVRPTMGGGEDSEAYVHILNNIQEIGERMHQYMQMRQKLSNEVRRD